MVAAVTVAFMWYMNQRWVARKKWFNLPTPAGVAIFLSLIWPIGIPVVAVVGVVELLKEVGWDKQVLYKKKPEPERNKCDRRKT